MRDQVVQFVLANQDAFPAGTARVHVSIDGSVVAFQVPWSPEAADDADALSDAISYALGADVICIVGEGAESQVTSQVGGVVWTA